LLRRIQRKLFQMAAMWKNEHNKNKLFI
jgi:hypothetical protein